MCTFIFSLHTMSNQYYDYSVPLFIKQLGGLKNVLTKAAELAASKEGGEKAVLSHALAPDMFPFVRQVQIACDNAKGASARLAQVEIPKFDDAETTIAELEARIDATVAFLNTLTPEQFENAPSVKVVLPYFPKKYMKGDAYLKHYALPNFFFHVTTAYDIVRSLGGALGKGDYMNGLPLINED